MNQSNHLKDYTINPLKFSNANFYGDGDDNHYYLPYGQNNNVLEIDEGDKLFKMTVQIYRRVHDGYCSAFSFDSESEMDNDEYVQKSYETVTIYFKIPTEFKDKLNELIEDGELIRNDETEILFQDWAVPSNCDGSGYCKMLDHYTPTVIEYVEIG